VSKKKKRRKPYKRVGHAGPTMGRDAWFSMYHAPRLYHAQRAITYGMKQDHPKEQGGPKEGGNWDGPQ
jgi:hypothetical protein